MKKALFLLLLFAINITELTAQTNRTLKFKFYDKVITFNEEYVDAWFSSFKNTRTSLYKDSDLTYKEYTNFKNLIIYGNSFDSYFKVDNLGYFYLPSNFPESYYEAVGSDDFKKLLKSGSNKKELTRLMEVRGNICGGFVDLIINAKK